MNWLEHKVAPVVAEHPPTLSYMLTSACSRNKLGGLLLLPAREGKSGCPAFLEQNLRVVSLVTTLL